MAHVDEKIFDGENTNRDWQQNLMVIDAYSVRSKEANQKNQCTFEATVGLAAGVGNTLLMICGNLQYETRKQLRHLDLALSKVWLTVLEGHLQAVRIRASLAHVRT